MTREELHTALTKLVAETDTQNEKACGELLESREAASVLLPSGAKLVLVDAELRTSSGNVDLLVSADETVLSGAVVRRLFVWELKAPQVYLFRVETKGRASPSKELFSAENQLLHYHAHVAGSEQDRKHFGVVAAGDVRLGGIIIGTQVSFVATKSGVSSEKARLLAEDTLDIRERVLYRHNEISLLDWTMVLSRLDKITADHTAYAGSPSVSVPLSTGPTVVSTGDPLPGVSLGDGV